MTGRGTVGTLASFISMTGGRVHDVNILDETVSDEGAFYLMDRSHLDFRRLFVFTLSRRKLRSPRATHQSLWRRDPIAVLATPP